MIFKNRYPNIADLYELKEEILIKLNVNKLVIWLKKHKITPNQITLVSILFGIASIITINSNLQLFILFYVTNRLLDGLDGFYARSQNITTKIGSHLDHFGDYFVHLLLLLQVGSSFNIDLALITATTYTLEFIFLEIKQLTKYKFPTSIFAYFFLFEAYKTGLIVQITYQIISIIYFYFTYKPDRSE